MAALTLKVVNEQGIENGVMANSGEYAFYLSWETVDQNTSFNDVLSNSEMAILTAILQSSSPDFPSQSEPKVQIRDFTFSLGSGWSNDNFLNDNPFPDGLSGIAGEGNIS